MAEDEIGSVNDKDSLLHIMIVSLAILFFFQGARELIGSTYNSNLSTMAINISVLAVVGFLSPALYPIVLKRLNQKYVMLISGILVAISRLMLSCDPGAGLHHATSFVLVSSALIFIISLSYLVPGDLGLRGLIHLITTATLIAICLDMALRAIGGSFDISIYGFTELRDTSLIIAAPLALMFLYGVMRFYSMSKTIQITETRQYQKLPLFGIGIGLLLFIYMTFSGYPNCNAGWTSMVPIFSYLITVVSLFVFIILYYLPAGRNFMLSEPGLLIFEIILAITFIMLIMDPTGIISGVLLSASVLPLAVLFYNSLNNFLIPNEGKNRVSVNVFLTGFVFVVLVFMSVLTLTWAHVPGTAALKDKISILALSAALASILFTHISYRIGMRSRPDTANYSPINPRPIIVIFCILALICTAGFPIVYSDGVRTITTGDTGNITVMTYNIHQGYGMDGILDPWEILNSIREVNPDILVLQESETNRLTSMNVDILNWLAYKLEMHVYSGPSAGEQIYGLALLSKYEINESSLYYLESIEDQRVWFRCQVNIGSETLAVYGIHVGLSPADRTSQSNEVIERLANETMPFIIMGDFNTWPNETIYSNLTGIMHDAWLLTGHELNGPSTYTFESIDRYERIDYIFVSYELVASVISCHVMTGQEGSDHLPVWAELNID